MKKTLLLTICAFSLFAQEENECEFTYWDLHPLHVGGNLIALGSADVEGHRHAKGGGHLTYRKANAYTYMIVPISRQSFFIPRVEWNAFTLDWNKNPKFHEHNFQFMQFSLTFHTTALDQWRWIARAEYNQDLKHFTNPGQYGLFTLLFWGRNEIFDNWHYHIGGLGYTGMEGSTIYPVIGLDYTYKKWLFEFVFPITYQIQYSIDDNWKLALVGRPLKERFRTDSHQPQPNSVFNYSSIGSELNVKYERFLRLEVEGYLGYNWGGSFYIKDKRGHNPLYEDVYGSFYGGVAINIGI